MDWSKAKNYTIVLLIFLNLFLFLCNLWFNKRYVIDNDGIESIKTILEKKNIQVEADIPVDYNPMVQINLGNCVYDDINLQKIFFEEEPDVKRISDFEKIVLISGDKKVVVSDDIVEYEDPAVSFDERFGRESVLRICEKYAENIDRFYDGLCLYSVNRIDNYYIVEYVQKYKGTEVFNNYIKFNVSNDGHMKIKFRYFPIKGMYGEAVDICSADEALFIFSDKAAEVFGESEISITRITKGYYFNDFEKGNVIVSVPHYRIEVDGQEFPFFVNAYNRRVVDT